MPSFPPAVPPKRVPKSVIFDVFSTQMIFYGLMSRWMKLRLWISMTPREVSRQISKKSLSSMCVFMSMSLLREQVPSSKRMYMVLKRSLSVSVSTCWHRFV